MNPTIQDLLIALKRGDRDALATLIQQESSRFERFFLSQGTSTTDVDDRLQDFWIKVWSNRSRYNPAKGSTNWLYTIASRLVIDAFRRHKVEVPIVESMIEYAFNESLDYKQLKHICLEALPAQQRLVFYLCAVEGLTPSEAAEMAGMNPSTLRNHWMIARKKIQNLVSDLFPDRAP